MILKNYCAYRKLVDGLTSIGFAVRTFTGTRRMSDGNELTGNIFSGSGNALKTLDLAYGVHLGFLIGTGTTPPTSDDYVLENDVTSDFSNRTFTVTQNLVTLESGDAALEKIFNISALNSTASTINISEVGIYKYISASTSDDGTPPPDIASQRVLFIRHVFPEPIEVPANSTISIVLKWDIG